MDNFTFSLYLLLVSALFYTLKLAGMCCTKLMTAKQLVFLHKKVLTHFFFYTVYDIQNRIQIVFKTCFISQE